MAYMVSSLCVVVLCVVLQHHPTAAFTCYSCSATSPEDSCCTEPDSAQTCDGSGCATVYYPGTVSKQVHIYVATLNGVKRSRVIEGANRRGRPHREWLDYITERASLQVLSQAAIDRKSWKSLVKMTSDTYGR